MAEQKEDVKRQKVTLKNSARAPRVVFDVDGQQHLILPGQEVEVELPEPQAKKLKELAGKGSGDLVVDGADPEAAKHKGPDKPAPPPEHASRAAMAKKEAEVMKAGQEASKQKEPDPRSGAEIAAETGIGAHAFGAGAVEVVTRPPDAPPEHEEHGHGSPKFSGGGKGFEASSNQKK